MIHMIWAILGVRDKGILFKPIPVEAGSGFVLSTPMAKQKSNGVLVVSSQVSRPDRSKFSTRNLESNSMTHAL